MLIREVETSTDDLDVLTVSDAAYTDIWFELENNALVLTQLSGNSGSVTIDRWNGAEKAVDTIQAGGYQLDASGVDLLLQAMAGFAPPRGDMTALTPETQTAIADAMAIAWKAKESA